LLFGLSAYTTLLGCSAYDAGLLSPVMTASKRDASPPLGAADAQTDGSAVDGQPASTDAASPANDAAPLDSRTPDMDSARPANEAGRDAALVDAGGPELDASMDVAMNSACGPSPDRDCCPNDPNKTAPGVCGCGVADTDGDGDGTPDCNDVCPTDNQKSDRGVCGCGFLDGDQGGTAGCLGLRSALIHRYRFEGSGTTLTDSKSSASGMLVGTTLNASGSLVLAGGTSSSGTQYADLPDALVSGLSSTTLECWITWSGGNAWQRIFDFGNGSGTGQSYFYLTPRAGNTPNVMRVAFTPDGYSNEVSLNAAAVLPSGVMKHVAVVVNSANDTWSLFVDGAQVGTGALTLRLSVLRDVNNWLGRSAFSADPWLAGSIQEFRIYGAALTEPQLATSFRAGPDAAFLE
jgi:hypothetical protein